MVPMLETIRRQAMERIAKREKKSNRHQKRFTPYVCKLLELQKKDAEKCKTYTATTGLFDVEVYGNSYNINITRKTCSCGKWQLTGIPCEHAYGAMLDACLNVEDFVSEFFSIVVWQATYKSPIIPMKEPRFWMKSDVLLIEPPPEPSLPGRKKKKKQTKFPRKKGKYESPTKKQTLGRAGRIMHCSKCGESGHNVAGCKLYPKKKQVSSQEATSYNALDTMFLTQPSQASETIFLTQPSQASET